MNFKKKKKKKKKKKNMYIASFQHVTNDSSTLFFLYRHRRTMEVDSSGQVPLNFSSPALLCQWVLETCGGSLS